MHHTTDCHRHSILPENNVHISGDLISVPMAVHPALIKVTWSALSQSWQRWNSRTSSSQIPSPPGVSTPLLAPVYSSASSLSSQRDSAAGGAHAHCSAFTVLLSAAVYFPPPLDSPVSRVHTASSSPEERRAHSPPPCRPSGVLSQFTLVLWGTGPSALNPSSSDFPRPSNNSCKTFDAQQICIGEVLTPTHLHTPE